MHIITSARRRREERAGAFVTRAVSGDCRGARTPVINGGIRARLTAGDLDNVPTNKLPINKECRAGRGRGREAGLRPRRTPNANISRRSAYVTPVLLQ
ncbi:hypothetical protein EVAR_43266_1 [Eumeta japonica]|uniref:Uncharacterized protein n=1 Tax=Eumeta variegata TaxID=151549 RepID=A0A4C1WSK5_EUMVA|nr:hypothetical protein EVAR_43266_1 [Eumeta japonica]